MCSKDLSRVQELAWIDVKSAHKGMFPQRFLDGNVNMTGNRVALTTFPRAGNSMARTLLEKISGIPTGSEAKSDPTLQFIGLCGDGHTGNDMVWVTKTHYPLASPFFVNKATFNKQIYLMRNPFDVISSCANMCMTCSHHLTPKEQFHIDFPEFWDEWVG